MEIVWEPKKPFGFLTNERMVIEVRVPTAFDGVAMAFSRGVSLKAEGSFPETGLP